MKLRDYLKSEMKTVAWLSKEANVPYTTVSEIVNGKNDIQKVQFGTVLRICKALEISADQLFEMCVVQEKHWSVSLKGDDFYMIYYFGKEKKMKKLCKNSPTNAKYIDKIAECYYDAIMCGEEAAT